MYKIALYALFLLPMSALAHDTDTDQVCMAKTIYHEARSENLNGQYQVAAVILNRVASRRFPNTICGVVNQPHQFSPNRNQPMVDHQARTLALTIAQDVLASFLPADRPLYFHSPMTALPGWTRKMKPVFVIGEHTFY